eukprot:6490727-Amphidinium_carterae.1
MALAAFGCSYASSGAEILELSYRHMAVHMQVVRLRFWNSAIGIWLFICKLCTGEFLSHLLASSATALVAKALGGHGGTQG